MLLYFHNGTLEWKHVAKDVDDRLLRSKLILEHKIQLVTGGCGSGSGSGGVVPDVLCGYFEYVRGLEYEEEPDYERWIGVVSGGIGVNWDASFGMFIDDVDGIWECFSVGSVCHYGISPYSEHLLHLLHLQHWCQSQDGHVVLGDSNHLVGQGKRRVL